jgi:glycine cleavage system transcriptional repressor
MKKWVALSAIGKDRPGIVAALSRVFFETGCNLEDSSMTQLKGDFAVLLLVSAPQSLDLVELQRLIKTVMDRLNLAFTFRELSAEELQAAPNQGTLPYTLVIYGVDHPGIVYRVAQCAADLKINITDLRTHVTQNKGVDLYSLILEVEVPGENVLGFFKAALEKLKVELKVEVTLNPVETDEL